MDMLLAKNKHSKLEKNKDISLTMIDEDIKVQINKQDITNKKKSKVLN